MTDVDIDEDHGRPERPIAADEVTTLVGFLDIQRATLGWRCEGVDAAGLRTTFGASSVTLGGLLKHMAFAEDVWFSRSLHDRDRHPPWDTVNWKASPDWDWNSAMEDTRRPEPGSWHRVPPGGRGSGAENAGSRRMGRADRGRSRSQPQPPANAQMGGIRFEHRVAVVRIPEHGRDGPLPRRTCPRR